MAISESTQIALSVMQTVGLLIPVIFLGLRPYLPTNLHGPTLPSEPVIDEAPQAVRAGYRAILSLVISGFFAGIAVLFRNIAFAPDIWTPLSILSAIIGLIFLGETFHHLRMSYYRSVK